MKMSVPCQRYQTCSCMPACRLQHKPRLCTQLVSSSAFDQTYGHWVLSPSTVCSQISCCKTPWPNYQCWRQKLTFSALHPNWNTRRSAHIIRAIQSKPLSKSFERVLCINSTVAAAVGGETWEHTTPSQELQSISWWTVRRQLQACAVSARPRQLGPPVSRLHKHRASQSATATARMNAWWNTRGTSSCTRAHGEDAL